MIIACPALIAEARQPDTSQMYTPWTKGALETNRYRNLFVEMGYSQKQVDAKLKEVFNDVFNNREEWKNPPDFRGILPYNDILEKYYYYQRNFG